jgi:hypothetical protein
MLTKFVAIGLGAVIALSPLAAFAETGEQLAQAAPAATGTSTAAAPTGSYKSEMRRRSNTSKDRARASAHHMRQMRQQKPTTSAPATTPKT